MDEDSIQLFKQHQSGDSQAAEIIFQRYVLRLIGLVRKMVSPQMAVRLDPEDITQSAFRSFFRHARTDRYVLDKSGDLWRLLAAIAVNKARRQIEFHLAGKRSIHQEQDGSSSILHFNPAAVSAEPCPEEVMELTEELEQVMSGLKLPVHREMLELRLAGQEVAEISQALGRSERSVRRVLNQFRESLEQRLYPLDLE